MATQEQIDANRENARKSTGPKTEAGKAASSANALSHGLTANYAVVLVEEDAEEFDRLEEGVIADLEPAGALQAALAQRVAVLLWRLGRVARLEAELFHHGQLTFERNQLDQAETRALMKRCIADQLGEEAVKAREKLAEKRLMIDVSIHVEAPCAKVLVKQQESARAYDQLARHEATLQRALNRTLAEVRRLRDAWRVAATLQRALNRTLAEPFVACETHRLRQPGRTRRSRSRQPIPSRPRPATDARPRYRVRGRRPAPPMPGAGTPTETLFCKTNPIPRKPLKRREIRAPERTRRRPRPSPDAAPAGFDPAARRLRRVPRRHMPPTGRRWRPSS